MKKMQRMMVLLFAFVMLIVNFIYVATANSEAFTMSMNVKEETWKTVYKEALRKIHTEAREQDKEILYW